MSIAQLPEPGWPAATVAELPTDFRPSSTHQEEARSSVEVCTVLEPAPVKETPAMTRVRKAAIFAIFAVTIVVVAAAFALSFNAISSVGRMAGVDESIAWLMPVCIDGAIIVGTVAWLWKHIHNGGRGTIAERLRVVAYPATVVLAGTIVSVWLNATHAQYHRPGVSATRSLDEAAAMVVSALPAVFLAVIVHLVADLISNLVPSSKDERAEVEFSQPSTVADERPVSATVSAVVSVEPSDDERPIERASERQVSAPRRVKAITSGGPDAKARQWIADQIRKGKPLTGAIVSERYGISEASGRRWISAVRADQTA